jgi:hypothetical protein
MFYLTTFVICATDVEDADRKTATILEEMEDRGWKGTFPKPREWTTNLDELKLDTLFNGISPA